MPAASGATIDVFNPATGEVIARTAHGTVQDVDRAIQSAGRAFESKEWGGLDVRARARLVNRIADAFEARLPELFRLETVNNGRPVNETRAQVSRIPDFFRYTAASRSRAATRWSRSRAPAQCERGIDRRRVPGAQPRARDRGG